MAQGFGLDFEVYKLYGIITISEIMRVVRVKVFELHKVSSTYIVIIGLLVDLILVCIDRKKSKRKKEKNKDYRKLET